MGISICRLVLKTKSVQIKKLYQHEVLVKPDMWPWTCIVENDPLNLNDIKQ